MEIVYTIAFIAALTALFTFLAVRTRKSSWSGTVTDIRLRKYWRNDIQEEEYVIKYRTDTGRNGKLRTNTHAFKLLYSALEVGDRLVKESGEYMPKVASDQSE